MSHHVESWTAEGHDDPRRFPSGIEPAFGAQCFTCQWAAQARDMDEADTLAQQHRDET